MEKLISQILAFFAKRILAKYKPLIIGVTGSQGKTSTRQAIFCVVKQHFRAYTPVKNFNTLLGLPLGILMSDSPGRSIVGWLKVFIKGVSLIIFKYRYPEVLVLEYGIDRFGEMEKLIAIARPKLAVLTGIGISHLESFKSQEQLAGEKAKLLEAVPSDGFVIVNADDEVAMRQLSNLQLTMPNLQFLTYSGYAHPKASIHADNISEEFEEVTCTDIFVVTPSRIFNYGIKAVGETHVKAGLAAVAVAESLKLSSETIKKGLAAYRPQPGRLNIIAGTRKSIIIDDTYNASPASMRAALDLLSKFLRTNEEKIAVMGDMLELGENSEDEHRQIGKLVAEMKINRLITVGQHANFIAQGAADAGMDESRIVKFETSTMAASCVFNLLSENKVILVKGSQGLRMEKIVKEIMAQPMRAKELLCRQDKRWLEII